MSPYPEGTRWNEWGDAVPPQSCTHCDTTIPVELTPDAWVYRCPNGCMTLTCRDGEWDTEDHTEPPTGGQMRANHDLYRTGDADAPKSIRDRNGEVALDLCRRCGRAEGQLDAVCAPDNPLAS